MTSSLTQDIRTRSIEGSTDGGDGDNDSDFDDSNYFFDTTTVRPAGSTRATWEVKSAWQLEETVYFSPGGYIYNKFTSEIIWTGSYFSAVLKSDGIELHRFSYEEPDMTTGKSWKMENFMTPFGEARWVVILDLDDETYQYSTRVEILNDDSWNDWGGRKLFFKSYINLNEGSIKAWYGDDWVKHEITDEKWAPAWPENETSRNYLLAQKEEPIDGYSSMWQSVGIAAATGFSLALCIYTSKRVKANRTDSD